MMCYSVSPVGSALGRSVVRLQNHGNGIERLLHLRLKQLMDTLIFGILCLSVVPLY